MPAGGDTIWRFFMSLTGATQRDSMAGSLQPIAPSEILAWSRLMQTPLHPDEARAIRALDNCRREVEAQRAAKSATLDDED